MEINNGQFNVLVDLYLAGFDRRKGTILHIAKDLGDTAGQTRTFLNSLIKEGIIFPDGWDNINGKDVKIYSVDMEKLLNEIKNNVVFQKITVVLYNKYDYVFGNFVKNELFTKKELDEMKRVFLK